MSNFEELLKKLTFEISQSQEHYVYYNKDTNRIHKISPVLQESDFETFAIDSEKVEPILKGINKLDDFIVYFDYGLKKFNIQKKQTTSFSNITLVEIKDSLTADLEVVIDKKNINFKIVDSLHEHIAADKSKLIFVITESSNPYKIFQQIDLPVSVLKESTFVSHQLTDEQIRNGLSIYTNKVFETYSLKVTHD